ncbi:tryptophan halogenase family protein [Sphingomonas yunnanensis]|uniref:tryptophan halogenase family protein n=1 Tax=Sphingomonas yunnanensis TaxID=310400 RepID=UPI0031BB5ECE
MRTIVIAGGGSAGWMCAAAFAHLLGPGWRVRLVESDSIGTVGVGEATIPQIRTFNQALGLDERAFLDATEGTYKVGIEFVGWGAPGERYLHAFGDVGRASGLVPFHQRWLRARAAGAVAPLGDHSLNDVAAREGRMQLGRARTAALLPEMPYAFHFDAALYAALLRRFAEARGVERLEGRILGVERAGETLTALRLDSDRRVAGELFVDCTGFAALLIGDAMAVPYDDWSRYLPCDRALALPCARVAPPIPYTRATAHDAGWQWRIPLRHRTGNGVVYSSAHLDDAAAEQVLRAGLDSSSEAAPRAIRFTTGRRREAWRGNVVAVGLAAGFMEPLESTSLHLVQSAIARLIALLPGAAAGPATRDTFNRQSATEWARIRDFLVLHYHANRRDGAFWRYCRELPLPGTLADRLALWREQGVVLREQDELFTEVAWIQVLIGQGVLPAAHHPLADAEPLEEAREFLALWAQLVRREVAQMPPHAALVGG